MQATVRTSPAPGRNQPCPCGSGRKHKHCCLGAAVAVADSYQTRLQAGLELLRKGEALAAVQRFSAALELQPAAVEAIANLGVAFHSLGDVARASVCYRQAIALDPGFAAAHNNLGQALAEQGLQEQAVESFEIAIGLSPGSADAFINLGAALRLLGRFAAAEAASRRALELRPEDADALLNLGNALKEQGLLAESVEEYRRAVAAAPGDARGGINLAEALRDQGEVAAAVRAYEQVLATAPAHPVAYSNLLYLHAFMRDVSPAEELALARGWELTMLTADERAAARGAASVASGVFTAVDVGDRRLRIGIVSGDLGTHAVAEFLEPFLEHLDRGRFHLTLFPVSGRHCERAARIQALADDFMPLNGVRDGVAVERIRGQGIDVLLDMSGHTAGNRLGIFARRAAPVQATWIGYWSTTGLTEMDYLIGDPDQPARIEAHFSEKLWRLSRLGVCYRGDAALEIEWQPDADGTLWLGSFNKFPKIREETIALWATALRAIPRAKLLLEDRGTHEAESHQQLRAGFAAHGVDPARVEFIPYIAGHERHMLQYNRLDLALDTVPFNGGTTTFDALWMGVPVLTVQGEIMGARISGAALTALGRPEWVATDAAGFAELVRSVADGLPPDAAGRNRERHEQRARMAASPLGDALGLTRALEAALLGMYDRWLQSGTAIAQIPL